MSFEKWEYETNGYKEFMDDTHAWRCTLCGDIHHGDTPPEECPYCLAPGHSFKEVWPKRDMPIRRDPPAYEIKALPDGERKDDGEWIRSIKNWKSWAHLKPV